MFRFGYAGLHVCAARSLTTYTTNDVGNLTIVREDFVGSMAARETEGGVAFADGFLYISSEAGLEIYDLTNTRAGGTAPVAGLAAPPASTTAASPSTATVWPASTRPPTCRAIRGPPRPRPAPPPSRSSTSPTARSGAHRRHQLLLGFDYRGFNDIAFNLAT